MFNFNQPKKENISKEEKNVFDLFKTFFPTEETPKSFAEASRRLANGLDELPDHLELTNEIKVKIQDAIMHIVNFLRDGKEYGSEIDEEKKKIVFSIEEIAGEYFEDGRLGD